MARHRRLVEELGGSWHEVAGDDVASALMAFATAQHATQIVLGTSRRSRWIELTRGSVINRVVRNAKDVDVHVIAAEDSPPTEAGPSLAPMVSTHHRQRLMSAIGFGAVAVVLLSALAAHNSALDPRHADGLTSSAGLLMFLGVVVVAAAIGGRLPAFLTAAAGVVIVDWYLIPPYGSLGVARGSDVEYLVAFAVTACIVAIAVEQAARRRVEALRSRGEADIVLALADRLVRPNPPQVVVDEIHDTLSRRSVALLTPDGDGWTVEASVGDPPISTPAEGEHFDLGDGHVLAMTGPPLRADEQRLLAALLSYLEAILAMHRLQGEASTAEGLSQANDLRNALLAAVSHDLRTPLASIKALSSGWLEPDVDWSYADTHDFMSSIDSETDRLHKLVENLLDMSRLHSGALHLVSRPSALDEIVPAALAGLSEAAHDVVVDVPEALPRVNVDPTLLERAIANVVDNALRHSGQSAQVRVQAGVVAGRVDLRVIDRGCGIPLRQRARVFEPFQRLGDTATETGVGLGLAVARGFVDAVGGELTIEETPGGGVTMVIGLPMASDAYAEECAS